jgi:hypothetical protein
MKLLRSLMCMLATTLVVAGGAQAGDSKNAHGCKNIHATGVGQDLGGGNTTATIKHGGPLNGTTSGHFAVAGSPPVFTIVGTVVFTTNHGGLTADVAGTFNGATGAFSASGPVSAGTGHLAGASGTLVFAGVENLATGAFTETITGTICRATGNDEEDDD